MPLDSIPESEVLSGIQAVTRQEILKYFTHDCCISSTRAVIRVLDRFGITAYPLAVTCQVFNKKFVDAILAGDFPPDDLEAAIKWRDERGAWLIGIVGAELGSPLRYAWAGQAGHVVAITAESHAMIDASLDQTNRPERGIVMPPVLIAQVDDVFLAGKHKDAYPVNGCAVSYVAYPDERGFKNAPDWRHKHRTDAAVDAICRHIIVEHVAKERPDGIGLQQN